MEFCGILWNILNAQFLVPILTLSYEIQNLQDFHHLYISFKKVTEYLPPVMTNTRKYTDRNIQSLKRGSRYLSAFFSYCSAFFLLTDRIANELLSSRLSCNKFGSWKVKGQPTEHQATVGLRARAAVDVIRSSHRDCD